MVKSLRKLTLYWILAILVAICSLIAHVTSAQGQLSVLGDLSPASVELLPSGGYRYGNFEVTWVLSPLTKEKLFQIASPTVTDRSNNPQGQIPVEIRAQSIEDLLRLEIERIRIDTVARFLPNSSEATEKERSQAQTLISTLQNYNVVQINHSETSRPRTIATVTESDADFYSEDPEQIAKEWQIAVASEIEQAEKLYSPETLRHRIQQTIIIAMGLLLATLLLVSLHRHLGKKQIRLAERYSQSITETGSSSILQTSATNASVDDKDSLKDRVKTNGDSSQEQQLKQTLFHHQMQLSRRLSQLKFIRWLLIWLIIFLWYASSYLIASRLPALLRWRNDILVQPLSFISIWFTVSLAIRIGNFLIQRSANAWKLNPHRIFGETRRQVQRSQTISGALQGLLKTSLMIVGILLTLAEFKAPVPSLLAGSAVIGLALSFGAQSLVKDLVNGCLILIEDQFAVGDIITANGESGFVERMNLRLTQLRSADGELITIPNSQISIVKNQTSTWSRVNLGIEVDYQTDLDFAIATIEQVALTMTKDPDWESVIHDKPEVLGVDAFGDNGITIRLWITTEPLQHYRVAREFRLRLKAAFDQAGIIIPFPQRRLWVEGISSLDTVANPLQDEKADE